MSKPIDPIKRFNAWMRNNLRRFFFQWWERTKALQAARVERGRYLCAACRRTFGNKDIRVDHISPVVDPKVGFVDWDVYISRLFCSADNLQILCKPCHQEKTNKEREERKLHKTAQFSDAARQRMSEIRKGHHDNLGIARSLETKQKMSTARKGKPQTLARARGISRVQEENKRAVIGTHIATGHIREYESAIAAATDLHLVAGNISRVCRGVQKRTQVGGWKFQYKG